MENEDVMECVQEQLGGGSAVVKDDLVNHMELLTIEEGENVNDQVGTCPTPSSY